MAKYKITKCLKNKDLLDVEFEAVIIKDMTLLKLVKKIASDVEDIKTDIVCLKTDVADLKVRVSKIEDTLIRNNIH